MKLNLKYKKLLFSGVALGLLQPAFAVNYPWTNATSGSASTGSYHFYYQQKTLANVLKEIAKAYNLTISMNSSVSAATLNKMVTGNFDVKTPTELLNRLEVAYGFTWFYYSDKIYVTSNQTSSAVVYISPESMSNIKSILFKEDLLNDKFGWTEIPSESRVIVSGPKEYVNLVLARVHKLNVSPINQQFAVYRLKYASPTDTIVNVGNQQIVIPGVATILQNIISGKSSGSNSSISSSKILDKVAEPLKNQAADSIKALASGADSSGSGAFQDTKSSVSSPLIQADSRLTAIIIRDKATNLKIYKSLIDMLDVPTPLIQVEAMIIDFDQYKLNQAGVSWWGSHNGVGGGYNADQLKSGSGLSIGNLAPSNLIVSNVGGFLAKLQFLEDNGLAKTESKSGIVTQDNIAAAINLTESFYSQNASTQGGGNPGQVNTNMNMLITPHVIFDDNKNKIKLSVALQDGNIEEKVVNNMPTTLQGSVSSQAVINAGQSLLIAGYSRVVSEKTTNQVPVLGSIPIVGWLFKNSSTKDRKLQRTYLITPKILWEGKHDDSMDEEATLPTDSKILGSLKSEPATTVTAADANSDTVNSDATNSDATNSDATNSDTVNSDASTKEQAQPKVQQPKAVDPQPKAVEKQPENAVLELPENAKDQSSSMNPSDAQSKANAQKFIDMISSSAH